MSTDDVLLLRRNAHFYIEQARSNIGLVKGHQSDLLVKAILNEDIELDDLLFVCVTSYWNSVFELLDLDFIIPHPIENRPILHFSLAELKKSALEPMTDVAEEPILAIKKRLEQADDDFDPICYKGKYWEFIKEDFEEIIKNNFR